MLANLLAIAVGLGSLGFYLSAFILPEVHRRSDFFWSGVGMFYALVLWYCARQVQGAVLLGQTASVGLLLWLGYQTLLLRRETTPAAQQTPIQFGKTERSRPANRPIAKDYEFVEDGVEDTVEPAIDPESPVLLEPTADEFAPTMVVPAAIPKPVIEADSPAPAPQPAPPTAKKPEKPNPMAAVGIFANWLKDIVTPKKKAAQPMVELPPRPPSIPKSDGPKEKPESPSSPSPPNRQSEATTKIVENTEPAPNKPSSTPAEPTVSAPVDTAKTSSLLDESRPGETLNTEPSPLATPKPERIKTEPALGAPKPEPQEDEDSNWPDDDVKPSPLEAPKPERIRTEPALGTSKVEAQEDDEDSNWPDDEFWD
ncbi:Ycf66 family protein [Leptothoe kymatousa]|uniref:Ycf66 n=1 Tax=Leptothoe kymatousa TAU-MAC 1615 TaxID=2364775 RepID=A0ABS5XY59_9CYAN|nr:Ycf66 family protein [Leptothoe kymatousa]MBT9310593.1 hypothetical protein [Leptothoe kymatousa TAU-MAC 1615]